MHLGPITSVVVSKDGQTVYTCGYDKRIFKWDRTTGHAELLGTHDHLVNGLSLSSNGNLLVCASADYTVSIYDLNRQTRIKTLYGHHDDVETAFFALQDTVLVTSSQDTRVKVWNLETDSIITEFREHTKVVNAIWCYQDKVFSAADDGKVYIWEMLTGKIIDELHFDRDLDEVGGCEPLDLFAIGCDDGTVTIYDAKNLQAINTIQAHERGVKAIAFSPSGKYFLTAGYDHQIKIWSTEDSQYIKNLPSIHFQWERAFAWSQDE